MIGKIYNRFLKNHKIALIVLLALGLISQIANFGYQIAWGKYIDLLSSEQVTIGGFFGEIIFSIILLTGTIIAMNFISSLYHASVNLKLIANVNIETLEVVKRLPLNTYYKFDIAYLNQRINGDSSTAVSFFLSNLKSCLLNAITTCFSIYMLLSINTSLTLLSLLFVIVYLLVYQLMKKTVHEHSRIMTESQSKYFSTLYKQVENLQTVKINAFYEKLSSMFHDRYQDLYKKSMKNQIVTLIYGSLDTVIRMVATVLILVFSGLLIGEGKLSVGDFIIFNSFFSNLFSSFASYLGVGSAYQNFLVSAQRLEDIYSLEQEPNGNSVLDSISGIAFEGVSFKYGETLDYALDEVNVSFEKGKLYVLQGHNGSGKSSLIHLALGLFQASKGRVYINNAEIGDVDIYSLRFSKIAVVEQEPILLFNKVIDNFEATTLDETASIAEALGVDKSLYHADRSTNELSGGEKQKLALLQALSKDFDLLILDEPDSALDEETTLLLGRYLSSIKHDCIIIVISHHKSFDEIADYSITFKKGGISIGHGAAFVDYEGTGVL